MLTALKDLLDMRDGAVVPDDRDGDEGGADWNSGDADGGGAEGDGGGVDGGNEVEGSRGVERVDAA